MASELPSSSLNDNATLQAHRKQANLKLLQRTCRPTITDITVSATHVVLYEYRSSWHKTTQEGTLFVVQEEDNHNNNNLNNSSASLILLNRHSTENFEVHPLTPDFQVQQQAPYLMFKHEDRVWGIWFPSNEEQQAVFDGLQRVTQQLRMNAIDATMRNTPTVTTRTTKTTTTVATTPAVSTPTPPASTPTLPGVALDKKALQLALLSLMQDDRFLTLLHQQYLKVIRTKKASSSPSASEK
jgi:mRNA-decapping enzyme 1B